MTETDAKLVETGAFRIDRIRTLEKLRHYQLPEGPLGFLSWIRCASAGGAKSIFVSTARSSVRIVFDGTPFDRKELQDPYRALFSREGRRGERDRYFAFALLWAWRAGAKTVSIRSGSGDARIELRCGSITEETLNSIAAASGAAPETATHVELTWEKKRLRGEAVLGLTRSFLAEACALVDARMAFNGEPLSPEIDASWPPYAFRTPGIRGTLSIPEKESEKNGVVGLYVLGVYAGDAAGLDSDFPFKGRLNDDAFTLNASLSRVVENKRLFAGLAELRRRYSDFLLHAAKRQIRVGAEIGAMLAESPRLRAEWKRVFDFDSTNDAFPGPTRLPWRPPRGKRIRVHMTARVAAWLRLVTETLSDGYARAPKNELEKTLWRAPVIFDVRGRPMSLERILREDAGPRLRHSAIRRSAHTRPDWIAWTPTPRDALWLRRVARRKIVDVTRTPERAW